jgi:hypothetical protein
MEERKRRLIRRSLAAFAIEALAPLGQTPARHHRLLIAKLEALSRGEIDRLMVLMPPGSAKSTYASVLFPAWWFCRHPGSAIIAASHTAELAERFGRRVRNLVATHSQALGYGLVADNRAAGRWETSDGGEYFAAGVGGSITGRRSSLGIIDDPVKSQQDAESETVRERIFEWYRSDFYTRLTPRARVVLIQTRWHEADLAGRLLAEMAAGGNQWNVLNLPALANSVDDPMGRAMGEPIWPEWETAEDLARKRATLGERAFGALFQQDPRPAGTSFFDVQNVLVDGEAIDAPAHCDAVFVTIDTAVKTGSNNDGTCAVFWAFHERGVHKLTVLDYEILQIEGSLLEVWMPTVFDRLEGFAQSCGARRGSLGAFIEDKASGMILLQQGARYGWDVTPIDSKLTAVGKDERAISVSGYVHSGLVKLAHTAYDRVCVYKGATKNHFLTQVFDFRLGVRDQSDDGLDAFCYGVAIALGNNEGF